MKKIISSLLLISPALVLAQQTIPAPSDTQLGGGLSGIATLINVIGDWMFTILIALAVVFILLAAYKYMISGGGEKVKDAHKMLIWAVVAIAVAILARGIVFVVEELVAPGSGATSTTPTAPALSGTSTP